MDSLSSEKVFIILLNFKNFVKSCFICDRKKHHRAKDLLNDSFINQAEKLDRKEILGNFVKEEIKFKIKNDDD